MRTFPTIDIPHDLSSATDVSASLFLLSNPSQEMIFIIRTYRHIFAILMELHSTYRRFNSFPLKERKKKEKCDRRIHEQYLFDFIHLVSTRSLITGSRVVTFFFLHDDRSCFYDTAGRRVTSFINP